MSEKQKEIEAGARGSGRTTRAIREAPPEAVFLVQNLPMKQYVKDICFMLGREDLRVETVIDWLDCNRYQGTILQVVVDHSVTLTQDQTYKLHVMKERWRTRR